MTLTFTKVFYELLLLPWTVVVTKYLQKVEQVDSYEKPSLVAVLRSIF